MSRKTAVSIAMSVLSTLLVTAAPFFAASAAVPCNIQLGSCTARTPEGMVVEFDVNPKPVTSLSELTFLVRLSRNNEPVTNAAVEVDLTMPGMFMGTTRPKLKHVDTGRYEGKGMIVRCASGRKTWQADVMVVQGVLRTSAGFVFEVQ
jgi:hypothetical protein